MKRTIENKRNWYVLFHSFHTEYLDFYFDFFPPGLFANVLSHNTGQIAGVWFSLKPSQSDAARVSRLKLFTRFILTCGLKFRENYSSLFFHALLLVDYGFDWDQPVLIRYLGLWRNFEEVFRSRFIFLVILGWHTAHLLVKALFVFHNLQYLRNRSWVFTRSWPQVFSDILSCLFLFCV